MGPGFWGGPPGASDKLKKKVPPPKSVKDLPRFLKDLLGGFFTRLSYIFGLVWETGKWILISLMVIALFKGFLPVIGSIISKDILNELQSVISNRVAAELSGTAYTAVFWGSMVMFLLIFYFAYRILNQLVSRINSAVIRIAGEKVVRQVKVKIMQKAKEVDLASFDMPEFYERLENADREAGVRPIGVLSSTFDTISTLISLVSYIIILATAPDMWWMAIVMLLVSVPSAIINFSYRRKNFRYMRHRSKDRRQMNYYSSLMVNKDMVKEIRMFGLSDELIGRYENVFEGYYKGLRGLILKENIFQIITSLVASVVNCIFFAIIAIKVFDGGIQIGDYSLYTGALTSIATTVTTLISISASVYEGTLFIDNLILFMNERPTVVPKTDTPERVQVGIPHSIEFVNVSFSYPETNRKVLDNINLTIRPGETLVLVGLNGAGKTTLLKLLTRLYDPTEGYILLDGKDIREYDVKELYSIFGIIFQDFGKYAVSVSENISFGDISSPPDEERIKRSALQANADDYISKLPAGYDTALMKYFEVDGIELSIGQWQKLSIARAFYSNSDIIILDEPTASLDAIAEQEIFDQFDRLREGKTTIFVSHRLSSATIASKIVVLEYGRIVEEGDHKTLMAKKGKYYELFSTQAKRYIEDNSDKDKCTNNIN
ncbi:MAG: ABC transporter ATP-binding protein [Ruminococcaceae bacterium]|nr:ABC transporter ATP-binding protein [Oscillospiraceae bacterium]